MRVALEDNAACFDLTVGGRVLDKEPSRFDRDRLGGIIANKR